MYDVGVMDKTVLGWLESFPYDQARRDLAELEADRQQIDLKIADLSEMVAFYERHRPVHGKVTVRVTPRLPLGDNGHFAKPATHAAGALALLEDEPGKPFTLRELSAAFYRQGWFRPDVKNGTEILRLIMRKIAKENPNVRQVGDNPITYTYRLPVEVK